MSGFVHLHCHSTWSLLDGTIPAESLPYAARYLGFDAIALTDHDALTGAVRFSHACRDAGIKPIYGAELTLDDGSHVTALAKDATGYGNLCRLITDAHLSNERRKPKTTFAKITERAEGLFILSGCASGEVARLANTGAMPEAEAAAVKWRQAVGEDFRIEVFDHRGYGDHLLRDRLLGIAKNTGIPAVATNDVHYPAPRDAGAHEVLHAIREIVPLSATQALRRTSEYCLKDPFDMADLFYDAPDAVEETWRIAEACDFDIDLDSYHFPQIPWLEGISATSELARRCFEGAGRRFGSVPRAVDDRLQHELRLINKLGFAAYFLLVADIVRHTKEVLGIRCACRGSAAGSLVCYVLGISDVDPVRYDLLFERFMNERREELPDIDIDVESHRREEVLKYILDTYGSEQTAMCCMVDTFRARGAIREVGKALGMAPEEIDVVAKSFPRIAAKDIPQAIDRLPELIGSNLRAGQLEQLFELCLEIDGFPRHLALHPSGVILSSPDLADRVPMQESFQGFTMLQADKDDVEELGLAKLDVLGVRMLSSISHAAGEIERTTGERVDLDSLPHDDVATFELIRSSKTLGCFQIESPGQRELLARFQPGRFDDLIIDISLFRPGPVKSDMVSPFLDRRHGFQDVSFSHEVLRSILAETNGVVVYHEQVIRVIAAVTGCSLADADYVRRHLDAERPAAPDDPNDRPKKSSSHPGMGREFRGQPEAIVAGSAIVDHFATNGSLLGDEWVKNPRVEFHGVAGPIEIKPPEDDVAHWFISSAIRNGFAPVQAEALWKEVFAFASFGFCKSHAAAFALPTYISAWLKAHHPAAFLAGVLTHDPGMYPRRLIAADARHFGVPILPVDVNASHADYRVEPVFSESPADDMPPPSTSSPRTVSSAGASLAGAGSAGAGRLREVSSGDTSSSATYGIRMALSGVRDISDAEMKSILDAREADGPFTSLEDLWRRTDLSRPVLENLVHVGALESIESKRSRRELLWRALDLSSEVKARPGTQLSFALDEPVSESLAGLPPYAPIEEIEAELDVTGIDARRHIMDLYAPLLADLGCTPGNRLLAIRNNSKVWVAGVKVASQTPAIRSGQRIIFVTLDDFTGPIDVTVFERVQPRCARTVFHSWLQVVHGYVRKRGGASRFHPTDPHNVGITVVAEEVFDLAELAADRTDGYSLNKALNRQRRKQALAAPSQGSRLPGPKLWHSSGGSSGR